MAEYQACDFSEKTDLLPPDPCPGDSSLVFHADGTVSRRPSPCDTCDYYATQECRECGNFGVCVSSITG